MFKPEVLWLSVNTAILCVTKRVIYSDEAFSRNRTTVSAFGGPEGL